MLCCTCEVNRNLLHCNMQRSHAEMQRNPDSFSCRSCGFPQAR